jgi:hypothetical protein
MIDWPIASAERYSMAANQRCASVVACDLDKSEHDKKNRLCILHNVSAYRQQYVQGARPPFNSFILIITKVVMSSTRKNPKRKSSDLGDLDERPRQGTVDPSIGLKDNLAEIAESSSDNRRKLISKASKSPAEEKEEERAKNSKKF